MPQFNMVPSREVSKTSIVYNVGMLKIEGGIVPKIPLEFRMNVSKLGNKESDDGTVPVNMFPKYRIFKSTNFERN